MIDLSSLRVYEGSQGEYAHCGDYSKGTHMQFAERTWDGHWHAYDVELTPELIAALDAAPRKVSCG